MSHKKLLHVLFVHLTIMGLILNLGSTATPALASNPTGEAQETNLASATPTATTSSITPTPGIEMGAKPQVWLDGAIDPDQFGPLQSLVIHFNILMLPMSSSQPILSWPDVQGVSSWDSTATTLTFTPNVALDAGKTYTFFLDPALRSADGKTVTESGEWIVHVQSGLKVQAVSPQSGSLDHYYKTLEVHFDRPMKTTTAKVLVVIEPSLPFDLKWKNDRILQIFLQQPFDPEQRYDLTLRGGNTVNSLFAVDGSYLAEDYRWFYWQKPFETNVEMFGAKTLRVHFTYYLDSIKSGKPFSITPQLAGKWTWFSSQELRFDAIEPIPASQEFKLHLVNPLVDKNGFEINDVPDIPFVGQSPIRLVNSNITKSQYTDGLLADPDLRDLQIEFNTFVDHASVEKAFAFTPAVPGTFRWAKAADNSKETLIYTFGELLKLSNTYTLKIDATVRDRQGQAIMVHPYKQTFMTSSWGGYYSPSFGEEGDNIQVVDANGQRRIQFGGGDKETNFVAFRFDLIDFEKLYADYYHYRSNGNNVRDIPIPSDLEPAATWRDVVRRDVSDSSITETILPDDLAPGLYVVNMRQQNVLYDQIFVVLTSNVLVVKYNGNELLAWLTDINGKNIPEAEIRVYSTHGEKVREGKTDENGQYRVSIPDGVEPMLISARVDKPGLSGDVALVGLSGWYSSSSYYDYGWGYDYLPESQPYLTYIYTERPIYRPGQSVNFKTIVRKDNDVRYSLLDEGTPVDVRVLDARGNAIENMELHTDRFGTINGTFNISEGAMLGTYSLEVGVNGSTTSQIFKVDDYRKPDYQIELTSLQPEKQDKFIRDEEVKVKVHVSYYFGEPLANSKLTVNIYSTDGYYGWQANTKVSGSLQTDANGETTLTFKAPYNLDYYSSNYSSRLERIRMDVTANDGSNQTVTGVYTFSVFPASEVLSLDTGGYFVQPGETFSVTAHVTDLFNQPIADRKLLLTTASWNRTSFDFNKTEQKFELQTDAKGIVEQSLTLIAGYHQLTLTGEDLQGHEIQVQRWVYVFKSRQDWFTRNRNEFLTIAPEKDSYKPYETAGFAIESTFSGPALLTFERGSVINTKMIELTAPLTIVESEIIPEHAPNVYVTVNAWQAGSKEVGRNGYSDPYTTSADSYLRLAETEITVDSSSKALNIGITTDKQTYAPGEKLTANIQVNDANGKPVLAELSLAVVDEAIYALSNDLSANIFDTFYGPRGDSVNTYDSMAPSRFVMVGGRGGGGGGGMPPTPRSNFPDTSAWLPVIITDENGKATVTIDLPDNTTSWRLSVKAITLNHQVGQAMTNVETKKEIFVRPVLPRILTNGDQATLTAFIHNYSAQTQIFTVQLSAPGLEIRNPDETLVSLKPGEVLPIGWQVRVHSAKSTQITITAKRGAEILDSVLMPLPLQPAAIQDVQNQSGQFNGTLTLVLPLPNVEKETSEVRLTLNRSMSGTLLNGLEYLTGYPYGCVEQTMSRALPNAVVAHASTELGVGGPEMQARLDPLIKASIQRLYGFQHSDGGWGWWTDDVSDPYQTAWVLFGLGVMNDSGYVIEPKVMDTAAKWLNDQLGGDSQLDIRTKAYALYSLAQSGRGNLQETQALVSTSINELDPFSQAALAMALEKLGRKEQAQVVMDMLSKSALKDGNAVYWPQPNYDGEYHNKTMASSVRTTAFVLLAYAEIEPHSELVSGIVTYLTDKRQGIYGWGTTNETSFTILALTEHLINQENQLGSTPYEVLVNGKSLAFGTLDVGNSNASIEIPLAELKGGINSLLVQTQNDNPIYFDLSTRYDLLQSDIHAAGNIIVSRNYLDAQTKKPIESFKGGQLVKVELKVQVPENAYFLAVEDHLPGGLEALNEGLSTTSQVNMDPWGYEDYQPYYWEDYGYNYKEIRGDRVVFFITILKKGTHTFTYYARVTTSGQFTALPTQVYAMYDLNLWGRSESANIQVNK